MEHHVIALFVVVVSDPADVTGSFPFRPFSTTFALRTQRHFEQTEIVALTTTVSVSASSARVSRATACTEQTAASEHHYRRHYQEAGHHDPDGQKGPDDEVGKDDFDG